MSVDWSGSSYTDVDGSESLDNGSIHTNPRVLGRYFEENYESEDLRFMLRDRNALPLRYAAMKKSHYKTKDVLPDWIAKTKEWKATTVKSEDNDVAHIFAIPQPDRTLEQNSQLVSFLMNVWQTANKMGLKRSTQMLNEFKYIKYRDGEHIITEGKEGLTFYIIISGTALVHKDQIGVVAKLGQGKSFGELALEKGDVRTASIIAEGKVECLSLHKADYDHFLKDIQQAERRENFYLLRDCKLFEGWPRAKIDKLGSTVQRKTVQADDLVFKQGADTDCVYVIMEGSVNIVKEVLIESKNIWPSSMDTWSGAVKRFIKPVLMATLGRGEHFGEISVMQSRARGASAVATQKTTLLCIDKLEFLHMVNRVGALSAQMNQGKVNMLNRYPRDEHILRLVGSISGGPNSFAKSGEKSIFPNKSKAMRERERRAERILHPSKSSPGRSGPGSIVQERSITSSQRSYVDHEETQEERNRRKRHEASRSYLREQEDIQLQKALRKEAMGAQLREHASQVGASAEILAKREIEMGKRILIEATTHKNVDMDPLRIFRGNAATSMGNTMGFRKDTARAADFKPTMRELETGWR